MELTFLGTRGGIEIRSRRHWRHSALLVEQEDVRIMIDCGADWLRRLHAIAPSAIVLTHAHADHAAGLTVDARTRKSIDAEDKVFDRALRRIIRARGDGRI